MYSTERIPSPIEAARLKGCYEGVNFYRAEKSQSVPGASDIEKGTQEEAGADEACKGEEKSVQAACKEGFKAGIAGKGQSETCEKKGAKAREACEKGYKKGEEVQKSPGGNQLTDCEYTINPLSWIICPIIDLGAGLSDAVFQDIVKPLLEDAPVSYNKDDPIYEVWQGFRLIANVMLVGSMLIIVYAQTRGGDK